MRNRASVAAATCLLASAAAAQSALPVRTLDISPPARVAALDLGRLKGEPARLAWSPDGSQLYVQTREGGFGNAAAKLRHYSFDVSNGSKRDLDAEPAWASEYWTWKSGQASPDNPRLKIELQTEVRRERTTSAPMAGDLARGAATTGAAGASAGDVGAAAYASQSATVHVMRLKGATVGEFVNSVIVPGLTFGWGPKGSGVIAFSGEKNGRVTVMDAEGATREISGSGDAVLPAWSPDAKRLAWLQKDGRRTFVLMVADVSRS